MRLRATIILSALAAGIGLTGPALAAPGVVMDGTDIFAGPSPAYPVVGELPPGAPIEIFGCQPGWGWCDVAGGPYRGWAPAERVQLLYGGSPAPLSAYGPMMGLPLIGFAFGDYWGAHYRNRPWFSSYDRWGGGSRGGQGFHGGGPGRGYGGPGGGFRGAGPGPDGHPRGTSPGGPAAGWGGRGGPPPGGNRGGEHRNGGMPHSRSPGGNNHGHAGGDGHGGHHGE
ncbi:SH3 domain-containing protein [Gluconacetobacter sp. Hr-1-5]|uniref:SH3 domain-containing protein n=1 Tax=Gluconacetobacter sp. Hr-1-5 TaxID=3395370 RepID=UPI003B51BFAD